MMWTSYVLYVIIIGLSWVVEIGNEFEPEFFALPEDVRTEILAQARYCPGYPYWWQETNQSAAKTVLP
jgi:hypothetical protein